MGWWQILLIIVVAIVAGVSFGVLLIYLERRFVRKRAATSVVKEQVKDARPSFQTQTRMRDVLQDKVTKLPTNLDVLSNRLRKRFVRKRQTTSVVEKQVRDALPDLLEEVENNLKVATEPWAGELRPFETRMGDVLQDKVSKFPANLQGSLTQIYIDIRLANSIVRLSTEFQRRSANLDESYVKLCASIAEKINRIKPLIERLRE